MPVINHLLETALYVADLDKAVAFYERVLGFRELLREEGRLVGMAVGDRGQVLLLFRESASTQPTETPGGTIPPHDGHGDLHLAFAIAADELKPWQAKLADEGVAVESVVKVERGGTSLYFRDLDNHLVELATPGIWPTY